MDNGVKKVAILGAGLLGGSIAKAVKFRGVKLDGDNIKISVWSRSESTRRKCSAMDIFDDVCDTASEASKDADMVIVCTPTDRIAYVVKEIAPSLKSGAIVTDVGSVKTQICELCSQALRGLDCIFIGSHPMAGSEKIGVEWADENLFLNRVCMVAPFSDSAHAKSDSALKTICDFWSALGMRVKVVTPSLHDKIVARISHAPHLISGTLCNTTSKSGIENILDFAGPGFRDCTRVSSGSPDIWDAICKDNRDEIISALSAYRHNLDTLIFNLENSDFEAVAKFLRDAKSFRDTLV